MVSSVTIAGSNHTPITLSFDSTANSVLAQQIATRINAQIAAGTLVTQSDISGPPVQPPPGKSGAYLQTSSAFVVLPSGYTTDLITAPGQVVVFGSGANNEMILSSIDTSLTFVAASGSGSVVAGGGNDHILAAGKGAWSLNTADGNDVIMATGSGNDTVSAGGGHNTILLGSGNDVILSTGDDTIVGGSGAETIDATGSHSILVEAENSNLFFVGGLSGATILGGQGSDTYFGATGGSSGPQLIEGGSGGNNLLIAGNGAATLVGGGKGDQLMAYGASGQLLIAGTGAETLSAAASTGNVTLIGGSGKDLMIGGLGNDTFVGGSGQSTIQASLGQNVFDFVNQGNHGHDDAGTTLITGIFDPSSIKINLQGYGANEVNYALEHQTVKNGSVTVSLTDGTKITFQDVTALRSSNFT
jgi:Ca2+-binding RTX toxin-like protein